MDDPYLNDLKSEFREYSSELKILKKNLLKSNSPEEQALIIKKIDSIARDMEKNQRVFEPRTCRTSLKYR